MVLWTDTAPKNVSVRLKRLGRRQVNLKIWNVWRDKIGGHDVTQAWIGNAGMRAERYGNQLILRCSDGVGPVNFADLEVRLTFAELL